MSRIRDWRPLVAVCGGWVLAAAGRVVPVVGAPTAYAVVLLVPGFALWRALDPRRAVRVECDLAAAVVLGFAETTLLLAAAFGLHRPLRDVTVLLVIVSVVCAVAAGRDRPVTTSLRPATAPLVVGLVASVACDRLWVLSGDAPFHVGRVRRLLALDHGLVLSRLSELVNGSNHPGYALPAPHAVVAQAALLSHADPVVSYRLALFCLVPAATILAWGLTRTLFGVASLATAASVLAALLGLMEQSRQWSYLPDPPSTVVYVLAPAAMIMLIEYATTREIAALVAVAAASAAITVTHPTYLPFVVLVAAGAAAAAAGQARRVETRRILLAGVALVVPFLAYAIAVFPLARQTAARAQSGQTIASSLDKWVGLGQITRLGPLIVVSPHLVAPAGIALVALLGASFVLWTGRREAAWILGGVGAVIAGALLVPLPDLIARVVTTDQVRRVPLFEARPLLVVGAAAGLAAAATRRSALVAAAVIGVGAGVAIPHHSLVEALVVLAGCVAVTAGLARLVSRRRRGTDRIIPTSVALACVALLAAPWTIVESASLARDLAHPPPPTHSLTRSIVDALRRLPRFTVVAAQLELAYLIPSQTDDLIYAEPIGNTANTRRNDPAHRAGVNRRLFRTSTPLDARRALMRRIGVRCLVLDLPATVALRSQLLADGRFAERFRDATFALWCLR